MTVELHYMSQQHVFITFIYALSLILHTQALLDSD